MDKRTLALAKIIHETRIALCWGKEFVGRRDPWPDFDDPKVFRGYAHEPNPKTWVDIAYAQAEAVLKELTK